MVADDVGIWNGAMVLSLAMMKVMGCGRTIVDVGMPIRQDSLRRLLLLLWLLGILLLP